MPVFKPEPITIGYLDFKLGPVACLEHLLNSIERDRIAIYLEMKPGEKTLIPPTYIRNEIKDRKIDLGKSN